MATHSIHGSIFQEMKQIWNHLILVGSGLYSVVAFNAGKYNLNFNLPSQNRYTHLGDILVSRDISEVVFDSVAQNSLMVHLSNHRISSMVILKIYTNLNYLLFHLLNTVTRAKNIVGNLLIGWLHNF